MALLDRRYGETEGWYKGKKVNKDCEVGLNNGVGCDVAWIDVCCKTFSCTVQWPRWAIDRSKQFEAVLKNVPSDRVILPTALVIFQATFLVRHSLLKLIRSCQEYAQCVESAACDIEVRTCLAHIPFEDSQQGMLNS